ncbi:MAG: response regulator [Ignavibacteriaceae bacterium]
MEPFLENKKVLYVDDEPELLNAFVSLMRKENLQIKTLNDSVKIDEILNPDEPFALVLSDQRMPGYDGVHVLEAVRNKWPDTLRVLITGYADYKDTIRAINIGGINSYISKPWDDEALKQQVKNWISQYNLKQHNKYLLQLLDDENQKLNELLEGTVAQTVRILGDMANHVSPQVAELGNGVKTIGLAFLNMMTHISTRERWDIMRALDLFNLGIALLPPSIQAAIAKEGLSVINQNPVALNHHLLAAGLIKNIPRFDGVASIIELQAKDFDGTGEPFTNNASGSKIPFGARLMHILVDLVKPSSTKLRGAELLKHMERMTSKYDTQLIKLILGKHLETNFVAEERLLNISSLQTGMILVHDVRSVSGQLLLKANVTLTETFINILVQWHMRDPLLEPVRVRCMG